MRRSLAIVGLGCLVAGAVATRGAGADDTHTYRVEMLNAFGVLEGSEVRIAGVRSGSVTDLAITPQKRAVATIELSGPLAELGDRTTCSTEPQSLIAEYFIDCEPKGRPLADGETIPASRVTQTIQTDLLFNTLRTPYRERLRLVVNELGTGLAANGENLNEAIRLAVPALTDLKDVTRILDRQRHRLAALNTDASRVIARLAARRDDVAGAIIEAHGVAAAAAGRRDDLSRLVGLLDDTAAELRPTLAELGETARAGTPLLASLRAAAPGLDELAMRFPGFAASAKRAVVALGDAVPPGTAAIRAAGDEIDALKRAGRRAAPTAEILADLLRDLQDPNRAVEVDQRAARTCDDPSRPCWGTGRRAPTGYTGVESILGYVYHQALALNQFDSVGHILQFNVYSGATGPCDNFNARSDVPAADGGRTTDILEADPCVNWLGPSQPDISFDLGLPSYDPAVCPHGSTDLSLCDPGGTSARHPAPERERIRHGGREHDSGGGNAGGAGAAPPAASGQGGPAPQLPPAPGGDLGDQLDQSLDDLLDQLPDAVDQDLGLKAARARRGRAGAAAVNDVLDFLLAP